MQENIKVTGIPCFTLTDANGNVKQQFTIPNLVVTSGKQWLVSRAVGTTSAIMLHMAVGAGVVTPALGDTALGSQITRIALGSTSTAGNTITYACTFGAGVGTGALTEAGIFNAASGGTMLCRASFGVINKEAGDTLTISWNITIN